MTGSNQYQSTKDGTELANVEQVDGQIFKYLLEAGLTWLKTNQQTVNALNVFPVPDGDTGTNMVLTLQAAFNEIAALSEHNIGVIAHAFAQGALMGARGNSGVILSQIWRGFARAMDNLEKMDSSLFTRALEESRNTAYKGVVRPVEGTILTVVKDIAKSAQTISAEKVVLSVILDQIVMAADQSVKRTPDLLPILKQAGVVDAGGKGLYFIFEGMLRFVRGQSLSTPAASVQPLSAMILESFEGEKIEPGQDFEVVIDFRPFEVLDLEKFYQDLTEIGTSIQLGEGDGMYRMHIHVPTEKLYAPIDYTRQMGVMTKVAIENLVEQMEALSETSSKQRKYNLATVEPQQIAVVTVSPGIGISRIFASLGAAAIVEGGQTMNPSTEEILHAFENLPTDKIIILPNNKNIILAAQSAASVTVKKVEVIPSKSIPQGLAAIIQLMPDADFDKIVTAMKDSLKEVTSGEITVATRSAEIDGIKVNQGETIALLDGTLITSAPNLEEACMQLLEKAGSAEKERITLFYGSNISKNEVNHIVDLIREKYTSQEIELHEGGQPHYQFIISIE